MYFITTECYFTFNTNVCYCIFKYTYIELFFSINMVQFIRLTAQDGQGRGHWSYLDNTL